MRRAEGDDPQPDGKRLKLGNEGGSLGREGAEEGEDQQRTPCVGREESGTQTEEEGQMVRGSACTDGLHWGGGSVKGKGLACLKFVRLAQPGQKAGWPH